MFFGYDDMLPLFEKLVVGETYTMVLQVTSTCDNKAIKIGFPGPRFLSAAPPNAKGSIITVTEKWREPSTNFRLMTRTDCRGKSLTLHNVQFVKGPKNCFEEGMLQ